MKLRYISHDYNTLSVSHLQHIHYIGGKNTRLTVISKRSTGMDRETTDRIIDGAPEDAPVAGMAGIGDGRSVAGSIDRIVAALIRSEAGTTS